MGNDDVALIFRILQMGKREEIRKKERIREGEKQAKYRICNRIELNYRGTVK